jgi:hypothetical protein
MFIINKMPTLSELRKMLRDARKDDVPISKMKKADVEVALAKLGLAPTPKAEPTEVMPVGSKPAGSKPITTVVGESKAKKAGKIAMPAFDATVPPAPEPAKAIRKAKKEALAKPVGEAVVELAGKKKVSKTL